MNRACDPYLDLALDGVQLIEASAGTGKTYTLATLVSRLEGPVVYPASRGTLTGLHAGSRHAEFANPAPENRKRTMMITGIASLLVIGSAGGLMARHGYSWGSGWVIVKLVCWLGLSGIAGIVYRRPQLRGVLASVAMALILTALVMVYLVRTM